MRGYPLLFLGGATERERIVFLNTETSPFETADLLALAVKHAEKESWPADCNTIAPLAGMACDTPYAWLYLNSSPARPAFSGWHGLAGPLSRPAPHDAPALPQADLAADDVFTASSNADDIGSRFAGWLPPDIPPLRFYAGLPVTSPRGITLGVLCVADTRARALTQDQTGRLRALAHFAASLAGARTGDLAQWQAAHTLLTASADCIALIDTDGTLLSMNAKGQQIMEISDSGTVAGQPWEALWGEPFRPRVMDAIDAARTGGIGRFEGDTLTGKGTSRSWDAMAVPLFEADGSVARLLTIARDITEIRQTQRDLAASEARFRLLTETIPQIVWIADTRGTILYVSEKWEAYSGLPAHAVVRKGLWLGLVHPDDRAALQQAWETAQYRGALQSEYRMRNRHGEYRWFLVTAQPEQEAATGEPLRWFGSCTDIHAERQAREALAARSQGLEEQVARHMQELDRIWRLSRDLLSITHISGTILAVNPAWRDILGWEDIVLIHQPVTTLTHPQDRPRIAKAIKRLSQGETIYGDPIRMRHADGSYRWISWNAVPFDGVIYATGRDVTDIKKAAQEREELEEQLRQAQKMEAVGQLTGGIAHDFNNLLTALSGSLELMQRHLDRGTPDGLGRYIAAAQSAVERGASLTHRLLAFSRRQTLTPHPIDPRALIESMMELIGSILGPSITVRTRLAPEPWLILCDPNQLENALLNLFINARDAMPQGGALTISTHAYTKTGPSPGGAFPGGAFPDCMPPASPSGDYVIIEVTDDGIGMTPEVVARAFDPFFTTKPIGQGTGLGLSMIYGFVEQSGGHVTLQSSPGEGTSVTICFPRHRISAAQPAAAPASAAPPLRLAATAGSVLVVDDEETIRSLIQEMLEAQGYRVILASNGAEGLAALQAAQQQGTAIVCLITDIGLPGGMNGRELAHAARSLCPALPILLVTGYASSALADDDAEAFSGPTLQVLSKPFTMTALHQRLHALLKPTQA